MLRSDHFLLLGILCKTPAEAGCGADCWSSGLNLEKALVKKWTSRILLWHFMPRQKEMTHFSGLWLVSQRLGRKTYTICNFSKKRAYWKKKKKPETKVTTLAKLSAPLMLRYRTGSCLEAAQHSLGSQHSPRGSGWNATPLTISHLVHKRINRL